MVLSYAETSKRTVVHFPGFEPLDAKAHHARFIHTAKQSAKAFGYLVDVGPLETDGPAPHFHISAAGDDWKRETDVFIMDYSALINAMASRSKPVLLADGFRSAFQIALEGGLFRYVKAAWRFSLFFLLPYLLLILGLAGIICLALLPLLNGWGVSHLAWSMPLAIFTYLLPFRALMRWIHIRHHLSLWRLAISLARLDDERVNGIIQKQAVSMAKIMDLPSDELSITSHSIGAAFAIHALGVILERQNRTALGRDVSLATLGSTLLQSSLLKSARVLRQRTGSVLACKSIEWTDFQCLTDPVNFYRAKPGRLSGFSNLEEPLVLLIKISQCLTPAHYRRVRWNFMRVHRQFVLSADMPSPYDYPVLTCGPYRPRQFRHFWIKRPLLSKPKKA